jgi:hypothetical protein
MNNLFRPVNILDSRVAHIKTEIPFGVLSGSAQNTFQNFGATSQNTSTITYNVQVPSMSTVIDRNVLQKSTETIQILIANVPVNELAFDYGDKDALQAFPLNSLITTQTATINNTSVTTNLQDVLPQLLRMYDDEALQRYNSLSPSLPDKFWKNYSDAVATASNPLAAFNNVGYDADLIPRGSFPVTMQVTHNKAAGGTDASLKSTSTDDTWSILLTFTVVEPILGLSPFAHSDSNDQAGFLGINNLVLTFNLDASCRRVFSTANPYITKISLVNVAGSELLLNFLSLQPEQYGKIQPRNVLPYTDLTRYLYNGGIQLVGSNANGPINAPTQFNFSNVQLNQVPDMLIICARKPMAQQNWNDTSSFLTITGISINFNNAVGILSSANQQQLFLLSMKNGSSQTYSEFSGNAINNTANGGPKYVATNGSMLVLNPAMDFGLPSMYSASSGGQFNLAFTVNIANQGAEAVTPEIVVMAINTGLFITENGTSSVQTGLLTKEMVLQTKNEPAVMDSSFYQRLVGGKFNLKQISHVVKGVVGKVANAAADKALDYGMSAMEGAGESAGAMSAGSMSKSRRRVHRM